MDDIAFGVDTYERHTHTPKYLKIVFSTFHALLWRFERFQVSVCGYPHIFLPWGPEKQYIYYFQYFSFIYVKFAFDIFFRFIDWFSEKLYFPIIPIQRVIDQTNLLVNCDYIYIVCIWACVINTQLLSNLHSSKNSWNEEESKWIVCPMWCSFDWKCQMAFWRQT